MVIYKGNSYNSTKKLLEIVNEYVNEYGKVSGYKINT